MLQRLHSNVVSGALCNRRKPWVEKQPGKATYVLLGLSSNNIIFYESNAMSTGGAGATFSPHSSYWWRGMKKLALECPVLPSYS